MKLERLQDAISEAERFLRSAKLAEKVLQNNGYTTGPVTASAKRSSMDLTRALARLRNEP